MWTTPDIRQQTQWNTLRYHAMAFALTEYTRDRRRDTRIAYHWCRSCFYLQDLTWQTPDTAEQVCAQCQQPFVPPYSHHPRLCMSCAITQGLCAQCGGDWD